MKQNYFIFIVNIRNDIQSISHYAICVLSPYLVKLFTFDVILVLSIFSGKVKVKLRCGGGIFLIVTLKMTKISIDYTVIAKHLTVAFVECEQFHSYQLNKIRCQHS